MVLEPLSVLNCVEFLRDAILISFARLCLRLTEKITSCCLQSHKCTTYYTILYCIINQTNSGTNDWSLSVPTSLHPGRQGTPYNTLWMWGGST